MYRSTKTRVLSYILSFLMVFSLVSGIDGLTVMAGTGTDYEFTEVHSKAEAEAGVYVPDMDEDTAQAFVEANTTISKSSKEYVIYDKFFYALYYNDGVFQELVSCADDREPEGVENLLASGSKVYILTADPSTIATVTINSGTGMQEGDYDKSVQKVVKGQAINQISYQPANGYYFPNDYSITGENGITGTLEDESRVVLNGTPTADVSITLADATSLTAAAGNYSLESATTGEEVTSFTYSEDCDLLEAKAYIDAQMTAGEITATTFNVFYANDANMLSWMAYLYGRLFAVYSLSKEDVLDYFEDFVANSDPVYCISGTPATKYTVTVTNGTGGADFKSGATVKITANAAPEGKQFKEWTTTSADVTFADAALETTTFAMPETAVTVEATYEDIPETDNIITQVRDITVLQAAEYGENATWDKVKSLVAGEMINAAENVYIVYGMVTAGKARAAGDTYLCAQYTNGIQTASKIQVSDTDMATYIQEEDKAVFLVEGGKKTRTTTLFLNNGLVTYYGETTGKNPTTGDIDAASEGWKWYLNASDSYDATAIITDSNHPDYTLMLDDTKIKTSSGISIRIDLPETVTICGTGTMESIGFYTIYNKTSPVAISSADLTVTATGANAIYTPNGLTIADSTVIASSNTLQAISGPLTATGATIKAGEDENGTDTSYTNQKWVKVSFGPSITMGDFTKAIEGKKGTDIGTSHEVTLTISGDTFDEMLNGEDTFDTNIEGVWVRFDDWNGDDSTSIKAHLEGIPAEAGVKELQITIPSKYLASRPGDVTSVANENAIVKIANDKKFTRTETASFYFGSITYKDVYGIDQTKKVTEDITDTGEGWKWYAIQSTPYDPAAALTADNHPANTLLLEGANIEVKSGYGIDLPSDPATICGNGTIKTTGTDVNDNAIYAQERLLISNANITVTAANTSGIYGNNGVIIENSTVNAAGGGTDGLGIYGNTVINSGSLTASGTSKAVTNLIPGTGAIIKAGADENGTDTTYTGQKWVNVSFGPSITATGETTKYLKSDKVTITANGNGSEISKVEVQKDSGAFTDITSSYKEGYTVTANGKYIFKLTTADSKEATTTITYTMIDTTKPTISGIKDKATYYTTQKATVSDTNLDKVTLNDVTATSPITLDGNKDASYTIKATDKAGNETSYTVTMKTIASLSTTMGSITTENVKSSDKTIIETIQTNIKNNDVTNATQEEKDALKAISDKCDTLLTKISDTAKEIKRVTDAVNSYSLKTVQKADSTAIEKLISDVDALTATKNLTDSEVTALGKVKTNANALLKRISDAYAAIDKQEIKAVESITKDNVKATDKDALTKAKAALEATINEYQGNYTKTELAALKEQLDVVNAALAVIDKAANGGRWVHNNKGWWYKNTDGTWPANCWKMIHNKWYHFDKSGYMQTGWQKIRGKWYYLSGSQSDGAMKYGWQKINGKWYYLSDSNNDGAMKYGWQKVNGRWYYLSDTNNDGAMKTGWQKVNGKWYYMYSSGRMAASTWIGKYYVNSSGAWTKTR